MNSEAINVLNHRNRAARQTIAKRKDHKMNIDKSFEIVQWSRVMNFGVQVEIQYSDGSSDSAMVSESEWEAIKEAEVAWAVAE